MGLAMLPWLSVIGTKIILKSQNVKEEICLKNSIKKIVGAL